MKTLLLDIETAPITAYTWGLWNQNIPIKAIIDSGSVLCWSAKWLGDDNLLFSSIMNPGKKKMLKQIHKLLDETDVVVHYNGTRFDNPTLNKEFIEAGMPPPSPFKEVDLLKTSRRRFRFPSNKLDYVAKALGLKGKHEHEGFNLWIKCMNKDKEAWKEMEKYNREDVLVLESVYYKFLPWIKSHPNIGIAENRPSICPACGNGHLTRRGFNLTQAGKYQRYQCQSCGTWSSDRNTQPLTKGILKGL